MIYIPRSADELLRNSSSSLSRAAIDGYRYAQLFTTVFSEFDGAEDKKARLKPGFPICGEDRFREVLNPSLHAADHPRVRERIMKLSKVYSATCHHRYSSER
jgi:hypothetical protein